jgi:hypothetical protein
MKPIRLLALVGTVAALGALACDDPLSQCLCTEEFRTYLVTVVDAGGAPVSDVTITRTNLRTGALFEPTWLGMPVPGTYLVADDGLVDEFSSEGDLVRVTGEKDGATFEAQFEFAVPDECRCHVDKLAGPDTVTIG